MKISYTNIKCYINKQIPCNNTHSIIITAFTQSSIHNFLRYTKFFKITIHLIIQISPNISTNSMHAIRARDFVTLNMIHGCNLTYNSEEKRRLLS